ncbi:MAG: haloalkane dehalogenase [Candidatus Neomarinimicrobiota bacterium]|jgi:haloalkane dehalogenase|nr:haloalkane dehalogenase [Candidatus Neomarinimicrobiota bacterium]HJL81179.1 haloalkane dehalogenase [Gammaproteobacteria bacterium]|tara:strand:- start:12373 stop:13248 length:876 start_codon:yes stop_codon:yes gene_type:complete
MTAFASNKKRISVNGKRLAYTESGSGDPIIFLHGNPTSSYLWRNITPYLESQGRCVCIDLIGMGDSDKLDNPDENSYRFEEHYHYVSAAIESLTNGKNITFVLHDWGSALGFNWCYHNPESVKGITYMEAIVKEMTWEDWQDEAKGIFQGFRSDAGESLVLEKNYFVERVLPGSIIRKLSDEEMEEYRRPFTNEGEDRRPTLSWPREIPINNYPENVCAIVNQYAEWMQTNDLPKLFINAEPGAITTGRIRDFCRSWKNQTETTVKGIHFIQEDVPDEIGNAISSWYKNIE